MADSVSGALAARAVERSVAQRQWVVGLIAQPLLQLVLIAVVDVSVVIADSFTPSNSTWYEDTAVRFVQQRSLRLPAPLVYSSADCTNMKGSSSRELLPRLLSLLVELLSSSCGSSLCEMTTVTVLSAELR